MIYTNRIAKKPGQLYHGGYKFVFIRRINCSLCLHCSCGSYGIDCSKDMLILTKDFNEVFLGKLCHLKYCLLELLCR